MSRRLLLGESYIDVSEEAAEEYLEKEIAVKEVVLLSLKATQ